MNGKLYLCATPIGNLEDMTYRAVRMLGEVDLIAAEDTRNSIKILNHFDIHTPMTSYHEYNKWDKGRELVEKMLDGTNIALITDAGMPGISDPGEELVKMAADAGIEVSVIPGASASVSALAMSGLPTRRFVFEGFLSTVKKERNERLEALKNEYRTIILYEAPHKLVRTLEDLNKTIGSDREVSICRELTKKHETVFRTTIGEALAYYTENDPKGEIVLIIKGRDQGEITEEKEEEWKKLSVEEHIDYYVNMGFDRKEALKKAAKDRGVSKRDLYKETLKDSEQI